jgi:hypothetical protein
LKTFIGKSRNQIPRRLTAFLNITNDVQPAPTCPASKENPMQEAQTQTETNESRDGKCCGKKERHRSREQGKCGSHQHETGTKAASSALEILQVRFARGEIDAAEFEEKQRLIANA